MTARGSWIVQPLRRLLVVTFASSAIVLSARQAPPVAGLLERAGQYVKQFEQELSVVIADESYQQVVTSVASTRALISRHTKAEFALIELADEHDWIGVRNVVEVNGRRVADQRGGIPAILRGPTRDRRSRVRALAEESARYNVGAVYRNFSDPTFAALFLDPATQHRFSFWEAGSDVIDRVKVVRLAYREVLKPTRIRRDDVDLFANGSVWVDQNGRILRTALEIIDSGQSVTGSVTVNFRIEARLGFLVPYRMDETYAQATGQRITSAATYSNFRRFETSGRIVEPKAP
jgi:hypothetical protein